jgi:hypothetical protein
MIGMLYRANASKSVYGTIYATTTQSKKRWLKPH